jgi:hypothetical protein
MDKKVKPAPAETPVKISGSTVRADFNSTESVLHYARAAEQIGLWASERAMIERAFPRHDIRLLEAGCGAGRVTIPLCEICQALRFAMERNVRGVSFLHADATKLMHRGSSGAGLSRESFDGALFLFNGLMQIPGRENRRAALRGLHALCRRGAPLLFTTHDRDDEPVERRHWAKHAEIWAQGEQDPSLVDFGDRYFLDDQGYRVFMHLPDRGEVVEDLAATGWELEFDAMRRKIAAESRAVREFSDECRFWLARKPAGTRRSRTSPAHSSRRKTAR